MGYPLHRCSALLVLFLAGSVGVAQPAESPRAGSGDWLDTLFDFELNPYVSASGGVAFVHDSDLRGGDPDQGTDPLGQIRATMRTDLGYFGAAAAGVRLRYPTHSILAEAEYGYAQADFDRMRSFDPFTGERFVDRARGEFTVHSLLFNLFCEFEPHWTPLRPYVGAGIGMAMHRGSFDRFDGFELGFSGRDTTLAYQFSIGMGYRLTDQITLFGGYRYFRTSDPDYGDFSAEISSNNVLVGLRFDIH